MSARRDGLFVNDAAEFHGSSRPCCNVDSPVTSVIVSHEIGYSPLTSATCNVTLPPLYRVVAYRFIQTCVEVGYKEFCFGLVK